MFLMCSQLSAAASTLFFDDNANIRQAHSNLYALRPATAEKLLKAEEVRNPNNGYILFYRFYSEIISLTIANSPEQYDKSVPMLENYLSKLEKLPANSPHYLLLLGEAKVYAGLLKVKYDSKFSGLLECLRGYNLLEDNLKKYPNFKPSEKIPGVIKIGVAFMPPMLKFGAKLFGISSNPQTGMKYLADFSAFAKGKPGYEEESILFTIAAYKLMNQPEVALKIIRQKMDGFKGSAILNLLAATICLEANDAETALLLLSRIDAASLEVDFPQLLYLTGKAKLLRIDKDTDVSLLAYLKKSNGPDYQKTILYDLASFYYASGNTSKYTSYIEMVKNQGREFLSRDVEAAYEASQPKPLNVNLVRAALLVRGGYCGRAEAELVKTLSSLLNTAEKVQYHFLKGECYRLSGLVKQAESEYKSAFSLGKNSGNYLSQKALVQSGLMMEENGAKADAFKYYNACVDFKATSNPYSEQITNKAKAGLTRLSLLD